MSHRNQELTPDQTHLVDMLPSEAELGPCMKALTQRQQLFVVATLNMGTKTNHVKAARQAGYTGTPESMRVMAHRLAHDSRVQQGLIEELSKRIHAGAAPASALVLKAIDDDSTPMRDRLKAAFGLLDRAGLAAEQKISVTYSDTRKEKVLKVIEFAKVQGIDPHSLIGGMSDVIDGDYEVLAETEAAAAEARTLTPE